MTTFPLTCERCGAGLHAGEATSFITCLACGTRLRIHRTAGSAFTEPVGTSSDAITDAPAVVDRVEGRQGSAAAPDPDLQALAVQTELNTLDLEWERDWGKVANRQANGEVTHLHAGATQFIGCSMILISAGAGVAAYFLIRIAPSDIGHVKWWPVLVPVLIFALGLCATLHGAADERRFQEARREYLRRRETILDRLRVP